MLQMNFYGQNWKIWMWTMFISNKTALRATEVAKPLVFCVKSFQAESFLEIIKMKPLIRKPCRSK